MPSSTSSPIVDIHTHIYPPSYLSLLSSRSTPPQLLHLSSSSSSLPAPQPRLIILPSDAPSANPSASHPNLGRPIWPEYSSVSQILSFMNPHDIDISVLSLANPWLDFLPSSEAAEWARKVNDELETISKDSNGRIYALGTLPLSVPVPAIVGEIERVASPVCSKIRGVILGTSGLGNGLNDRAMEPVWEALQENKLLVFIHPHYGLPSEVFGSRMHESGHVLPLSLGFPLETTIAFMRMYLVGIFDRFPSLKILLAHAGGAVPALAGRVQSCVEHERTYYDEKGKRTGGPKRSITEVMKSNVYLDAVSYSETGVRGAVDMVGKDRVLFGTDHPFFSPLGEGQEEWMSVRSIVDAVDIALQNDQEGIEGVLGGNAVRLLELNLDTLETGRKS